MNRLRIGLSYIHPAMLFFLSVSFIAATSGCALAYHDRLNGEIREFRAFMQDHPRASSELQRNPSLAYNNRFLDEHEEVKSFLKDHPLVRREIVENPGRVFGTYAYWGDRRSPWGYR